MAGMSKQERAELKAVIKNRFKILRQDVEARRAELNAQLQATIKAKFEANDKAWNDALFLIGQAIDEANRKANDVMRQTYEGWPDRVDRQLVDRTSQLGKPADDRRAIYREHEAALSAQVQDAYAALIRQEGDLLERLVIGALESDEAREFLASIPTVAQLVPASRLAELAASLKEIHHRRSAVIMFVGLLIVCVIGAIIAVLYHLAETLPTVTDHYKPRHSAPGRASWLAEFRLHAGRLHDQAKRAAYLAMVVVPVEEGPDPADVWLDAIRAARPRLGPGNATGTAAYAQLRTEALESTNEQILDLVRHGIRPPSPWGTPEIEDSWEQPALVGAA